jgi:hypothetical protein
MGTTPLKVAAVAAFVLVAGVAAALNYEQILNPSKPALAQDEFDCASFTSTHKRRHSQSLDVILATPAD